MALNPQQQKFKEGYCDPSSPTFGNAYRSALAAGYEENYAVHITATGNDWVSEIVRDYEMADSAEKALKETIELDVHDAKGRVDPGLVKARTEAVKFALPALKGSKWNPAKNVDLKSGGKPLPIFHGVFVHNSNQEDHPDEKTD